MPLANGFLAPDQFAGEYFFNLSAAYCPSCTLVQLVHQPERDRMFNDRYPFFTATSSRMQEHFAQLAREVMAAVPGDTLIVEIGSNDGSLLSVTGVRPDLVLTMGGGARDRSGIAKRLGIRTLDLPFPQTVADVERGIALVGVALGRPDRARALLSRIAGLERTRPSGGTDTIWLGGGGRSVGVAGLAAEWMALAGFRQRALRGDRVSLEQLLVSPPRVLLRSDYRSGQYSGEQRWLSHPLARGTRASRTIATDGRRWTCMGPTMIDEIARLREVRR